MTIYLIANQKGGVGKSTIACCAVVFLAQKGKDVILVDADRQTSASEWWAERKISHPDLPKVHCVRQYGDIDETLEDLNNRYEYVVVDVAGRDSDEMRSAMEVCDTILMPFRPSQVDISTLSTMTKLVKNARRNNKKLEACAFLSIAPTNPSLKVEIEGAREAISAYPDVTLLQAMIYDRVYYRDAMSSGLGVTEMPAKSPSEISAGKEIMSLMEEVM